MSYLLVLYLDQAMRRRNINLQKGTTVEYTKSHNVYLHLIIITLLSCTSVLGASDHGWLMFNNEIGGLGFGKRSEVRESASSYVVGLRAAEVAYGFDRLGGVGCGIMLYEMLADFQDFPSQGYPSSWLPVYLYIPLVNKTEDVDVVSYYRGSENMKKLLYLEFGGSLWSEHGDSYRIGLAYQRCFGLGPFGGGKETPLSWAIRAGVFRVSQSDAHLSTSRYVYASFVWGGIFPR